MAFEKPPKGYKKTDRPLHHHFRMRNTLSNLTATKSGTTIPLIMATSDAVNPNTIEVRIENSSFAEDTGACVCVDSMVSQMRMSMKLIFPELSHYTDHLPALAVFTKMLQNNSDSEMDKADILTTTTAKSILKITKDATKKDCTPTFNTVTLAHNDDIALSTVTDAQVFGDYNLGTDAKYEGCIIDFELLKTARRYYSNKRAINNLIGTERRYVLSPRTPMIHITQTKFLPKPIQHIKEYTWYAMHIQLPTYAEPSQVSGITTVPTGDKHIDYEIEIDFNEWNTEFIQTKI